MGHYICFDAALRPSSYVVKFISMFYTQHKKPFQHLSYIYLLSIIIITSSTLMAPHNIIFRSLKYFYRRMSYDVRSTSNDSTCVKITHVDVILWGS